jgi:bacillithiol system protein YtxJ
MQWVLLNSSEQLEVLTQESFQQPQIIFKHSTRCSISSIAKKRLEQAKNELPEFVYFLDLIRYRSLSNEVAERFQILHQSPQLLIIYKGTCIYHNSHLSISIENIQEQLAKLS